jgi:hypothetical protein
MNIRAFGIMMGSVLIGAWGYAQDDAGQPKRPFRRPSLAADLHRSNLYDTPFAANPLHDHPEFFPPVEQDSKDEDYHPGAARSVVRHQPVQMRNDNSSYGFRNPGHLARVAEYYGPGDHFDAPPHDPIHPATYNEQISAESRSAQISAEAVGISRYNSIQNSINYYARPMGGYGFGMGFF